MGLLGDIVGGITGAAGGFLRGGPVGAITGAARGAGLIDGDQDRQRTRAGMQRGKSRGGRGVIQERPAPRDTTFHERMQFGPFERERTKTVPSRDGRRRQQRRGGQQVAPMIGAIGTEPKVVGNITRKDGSTGPILRCEEPNFVLAVDNRCYPKKMVSKQFRKWPPETKPPVTRGEWKALLKARRAKKGIQRMGRKLLEVQGKDRKTLPVED